MSQAQGEQPVWRLLRGSELVGEIHEPGYYDVFWTDGRFVPRGCFESDLRAVFDDAIQSVTGGDHERAIPALRTIKETAVLIDPSGQLTLYLNLIIEDGRARFRPTH